MYNNASENHYQDKAGLEASKLIRFFVYKSIHREKKNVT